MNLCSYGCGLLAGFTLKNGKPCCSKTPNSCPHLRKQRSERVKAGYKNGRVSYFAHSDPWNKGRQMDDEYSSTRSEAIKASYPNRKQLSSEQEVSRRLKISTAMKANPAAGGLRKGSGRGIKGRYRGFWCDSSWELAWVIYHLEFSVVFARNNLGFAYLYSGKIKKYYPDFTIGGVYHEVKGFASEQFKAKVDQFPHGLIVWGKEEMRPILEYVTEKYGKDFHIMYET